MKMNVRVATRWLQALRKDPDGSSSAESKFFDLPRTREVREFAQSNATSNVTPVGVNSLKESVNTDKTVTTEKKDLRQAPPVASEVLATTPGSSQVSMLSRYLVNQVQPTESGVPRGWRDAPKHPKIVG